MLILAGVVINLTIGENGLFKIAKQAGKNYTNAEAKELADLNNITNVVDQAINGETGGTVPSIPETPTIDETVLALKAGDYIKYNSGANGEILCRVLYPISSEYGLQIISDKNVKNVTLGSTTYSEAVEAYNNAIETLNNEAEVYINTEYAYDARCVGSLPTVEKGMFTKKDNGSSAYVTPQFTNASYVNSLDADTNYEMDKVQMNNGDVNIWLTKEEYWLASRGEILASTDFCGFYMRVVVWGGETKRNVCTVYANGTSKGELREYGLRPCISLKSDIIKITGGDGKNADTAYVIGK